MNDFVVGLMLLGSMSQTGQLPFWATSNQYGLMPENNGALALVSARTSYDQSKTFQWCWGASLAANAYDNPLSPSSSPYNVMVDELYASAKVLCFSADIGVKHREMLFLGSSPSLGSLSTSSGHLIESGNARSIPGYSLNLEPLAIPFTKEKLRIMGSYGDYKTLDNRYMEGALVHRMKAYMQYDPTEHFHIKAGLDHYAVWGGYNEDSYACQMYGRMPVNLSNYIRIITGRSASASGSMSDQINVLGDHGGAEELSMGWNYDKWSLDFKLEKPYNDKSGMKLWNFPDGLYTLHFSFKDKNRWISDVLLEYTYTVWQSGTIHNRDATPEEIANNDPRLEPRFDNENIQIVLGGGDSYFSNGEYRSGWTYYGHCIGSPLFYPEGTHAGTWTSANTVMGPENSRIKALHLGVSGKLFRKAPYKMMLTHSQNFGNYQAPYTGQSSWMSGWMWYEKNTIDTPLHQVSGAFMGEVPIISGLTAIYGLYADYGQVLRHCYGATIGIRYIINTK